MKQNKGEKSPVISSEKGKSEKENLNKKPLLIKPLNKPDSLKTISNQLKNPSKPNVINSSQAQSKLINQNIWMNL